MAPLVAGGTLLLCLVIIFCLFVCLFVYFFSKMAPEKNPEGRKTELTTKKDCELVNKTIVGA